jgi:hypothetical protein
MPLGLLFIIIYRHRFGFSLAWGWQYPTMIIFRTGSYTFMCGKSLKVVSETELFLNKLIEKS